MEKPDDVAAMLRLHEAGWGAKRIAQELGCSRNTVRRYLRLGGYQPYAAGQRPKTLDAHQELVDELFVQHRGNAEVVRQELLRHHDVDVSVRTVERAVQPQRTRLRAETLATVRFETKPGQQLQADFGELFIHIGGERVKIHLCVLTLGWSRRVFVQPFRNERQCNWLTTMEAAFHYFGGVPAEVLIDNARALVHTHNVQTGELVFAERFSQFAAYWGFVPRACAPYRPRTKGKDERGVGYVKRNAIAGRSFESFEALEAWLLQWMREVADQRVHGTTGEKPLVRFQRAEACTLKPLPNKPPFLAERELVRKVHNDACVEVDANWYSVPWALVKATVTVHVRDQQVTIVHAGRVVASHARQEGRRQRIVNPAHWEGLVRKPHTEPAEAPESVRTSEFVPNLDAYVAAAEEAA